MPEVPFVEEEILEDEETLGNLIADLLQSPPPKQPDPAIENPAHLWYLGLDIGTTGISAVLLNRSTHQLHPIYWQAPSAVKPETAPGSTAQLATESRTDKAIDKQFRLPLAVSLLSSEQNASGQNQTQDSLIRDFKPYLNLALPYDLPPSTGKQCGSQPVLSWSETLSIPLMTLRQALEALVTSLAVPDPDPALLPCGAVDLEPADLGVALQQLAGVIVSIPAAWSEAYRFNLREALLAARIVAHPQQICFLEESIATMLAAVAGSSRSPLKMPQGQSLQDIAWQGNTLILSAGAAQTELALVQLARSSEVESSEPGQLAMTYADFHIRTLAYAGKAIDQDIITQLLYPLLPQDDPVRSDLEQTEFPTVGEPDEPTREALQQKLRRTQLGRSLVETARALKLNLQQQNRFVVQIAQQQKILLRQDLTTKVLLPYVQRLNRELNALLNQTQIPALSVRQVVCTGGTASLGAITRWLQQKLPNALILQDAYPWVRSLDYIPTCSRVAYGLAALPLYPAVLDRAKHQYSDFFLLLELMRHFPDRALTLEEVLELLQQKGMEAVACKMPVLSVLEGQLPAGLVPSPSQMSLLTPDSQENSDYQAIVAAPLFHVEQYPDGKAYRIDRQQLAQLLRYCDRLFSNTHQPLDQPLNLELGQEVF